MPREWSDGAKCDALRVSDVIVDGKSNSIRGGLGSNVYPTVTEGAFATRTGSDPFGGTPRKLGRTY